MKKMFNRNKKAQIGETLTWIVATLIIIVILVFSIFITFFLGKTKNLSKDNRGFSLGESEDLFVMKSLSGYLLTEDASGERIFDKLKNKNESSEKNLFDEFEGSLAREIFSKLYKDEYDSEKVWLGDYLYGYGLRKNNYFNMPPVDLVLASGVLLIKVRDWRTMSPFALVEIKFDKSRSFIIILTN